MERTLYSTETLLGVIRDLKPLPRFWGKFFPTVIRSETEYIVFSMLGSRRILAPFVAPTEQGRPIYGTKEKVNQYKPAYIKPKDGIQGWNMKARRAGLGELGQLQPLSPSQRYNSVVADILQYHRNAIENTQEWMAAEAVIKGQVTVSGDDFPTEVVNFNRAAGHTVALTGNARWGKLKSDGTFDAPNWKWDPYSRSATADNSASTADPMEDLADWIYTMENATLGGTPSRIIMGRNAWKAFIKFPTVKEQLNTDLRTVQRAELDIGIGQPRNYEYKGRLSDSLEVWTYNDWYEEPDGSTKEFMSPNDVLLISPSLEGIHAYSIIEDEEANFEPLHLFPKMWVEKDPSGRVIMTQAAPLLIPMRPNCTFRATVCAKT